MGKTGFHHEYSYVIESNKYWNSSERQKEWPNEEYWQSGRHPVRWKGGPLNVLYIKLGVSYEPAKQDPLSKEERSATSSVPVSREPLIGEGLIQKLQERQGFWASQDSS